MLKSSLKVCCAWMLLLLFFFCRNVKGKWDLLRVVAVFVCLFVSQNVCHLFSLQRTILELKFFHGFSFIPCSHCSLNCTRKKNSLKRNANNFQTVAYICMCYVLSFHYICSVFHFFLCDLNYNITYFIYLLMFIWLATQKQNELF